MKTLSVNISELEFNKFGLRKEKLAFSDLVDLISRELTKEALNDSVALAEKYGLSKLNMASITNEVKSARKNAPVYRLHKLQ